MNPKDEGNTHINIYSKSYLPLGRFLSNFAEQEISIPDAGVFKSIEGYWFWLSCEKNFETNALKDLHGFKAKNQGEFLRGYYPIQDKINKDQFKQKIHAAIKLKIKNMPRGLYFEFVDSVLPFAHYRVDKRGRAHAMGPIWLSEIYEKERFNEKQKKLGVFPGGLELF